MLILPSMLTKHTQRLQVSVNPNKAPLDCVEPFGNLQLIVYVCLVVLNAVSILDNFR